MAANPPPRSDALPHQPLPLATAIAKKKRGGRQLRQVVLSPELKFSIRQFAAEVGVPRLMEPTGFRDFRGWLERVAGPSAAHAWGSLVQAMLDEAGSNAYRVMFMKEEVVREIVRTIVVPRPGESAKLVSTNCGRQCARPRSGNTLMNILERILVEKGIVTSDELEIFMRDRSSPNSYVYRDYQSNPARPSASTSLHHQQPHQLPLPLPQHAYPSPSRSSSMSLDVITTAGEPRLSQPLHYPSYPSGHPLRVSDTTGSSGIQHYSSSSSGVGSPGLQPLQHGSVRREDRLPSFKELQDSLEEPKR